MKLLGLRIEVIVALGCALAPTQLGCSSSSDSAGSETTSGGASGGTPGASGGSTSPTGTAGTGTVGAGGSNNGAAGSGSPAGGGSAGSGAQAAGGSSVGGASAGGSNTGGSGVAGTGTGGTGTGTGGSSGGSSGGSVANVPLDPSLLSKCTGTSPIRCTFAAPNGDYDVTAEVGDAAAAANSRLSAETKHFQGPAVATAAGAYSLLTFTVNVRAEKHDGGQSAPANFLDIMIDGPAPKLHGIGFRAAPSAITLFFAGDSTAADWVDSNMSTLGPGETGWAQELSMYLKPGIAVANYADSGETAGSFYTKFFSPYATDVMKAGDYVFVEFGTNDAKAQADFDNYKTNLLKYVTVAKSKGATPVILTPISRKTGTAANPGFSPPSGVVPAAQQLDQMARNFASEQGLVLLDMTVLTRAYYASVADKNSLFVDSGTHLTELGAIGVANVGAMAIKASTLPIKALVK